MADISKFEKFLDNKTYNHIQKYGHYPHWSDTYSDRYKDNNMENEECSRLVGGTVSLEEVNERLKKVEKQQKKILKYLKSLENTSDMSYLYNTITKGIYKD